jgi:serine/threonine-protein kinase
MVRVGQRLGKYRLRRRLARGGFADVFEAYDTIEGVSVALKVPAPGVNGREALEGFEREIMVAARIEHPNLLPLKNADRIDGLLTIAYPLGDKSLDVRLGRRMSVDLALDLGEQLLEGLAFAHQSNVIHCDVKPENCILFEDGTLALGDFGLAKHSVRTLYASSSGTLGYMAPEQAMGRPSARSDVFSAGLVIYRMLAGKLPEYPFSWPPKGHERLRRNAPEMLDVLRRALHPIAHKRFRDAHAMLVAYERAHGQVLERRARSRRRRRSRV